jgi:hypothetical protein
MPSEKRQLVRLMLMCTLYTSRCFILWHAIEPFCCSRALLFLASPRRSPRRSVQPSCLPSLSAMYPMYSMHILSGPTLTPSTAAAAAPRAQRHTPLQHQQPGQRATVRLASSSYSFANTGDRREVGERRNRTVEKRVRACRPANLDTPLLAAAALPWGRAGPALGAAPAACRSWP